MFQENSYRLWEKEITPCSRITMLASINWAEKRSTAQFYECCLLEFVKVESLRAQVAQKDMFISELLDRIAIVECEVSQILCFLCMLRLRCGVVIYCLATGHCLGCWVLDTLNFQKCLCGFLMSLHLLSFTCKVAAVLCMCLAWRCSFLFPFS